MPNILITLVIWFVLAIIVIGIALYAVREFMPSLYPIARKVAIGVAIIAALLIILRVVVPMLPPLQISTAW